MDWLALAWVGIIAFGVIMYVLLDGFDLGIGIVSIFLNSDHDRDLVISSILPVWDGNETWLVFGGAALYGAFPLAFSTILPILYLPVLVMVVALLFRGVAFEFRLKAETSKRAWDIAFFAGSTVAAFAQGLVLGTFVLGFGKHSGNLYQWLNPFALTCGLALVFGYVLIGSNRLIIKTEGALQQAFFRISKRVQFVILFFAIVVSVWSPYLDPTLPGRWFNPHYMPYLAILPIATIGLFVLHHYGLMKKHDYIPYWSTVGIFLTSYIGFMISTYPYIVPRIITYQQAAANHYTLLFMFVGACVMLPILLYYTYYSYKIFRGKVTEKVEY